MLIYHRTTRLLQSVAAVAVAAVFLAESGHGQTFIPTEGVHPWNNDANWSSPPFPNSSGAAAILPARTAVLTVELGQPITVGSLTVNKGTSGAFDTTILGSATNTLTFDGAATPAIFNGFSSVGTGATIIEAPVIFNSTITVRQGDDNGLRFMQPLSGAGGLTIDRDTNASPEGVVALSNANTYAGATIFRGSGNDNSIVVRLNNATALPGGVDATGGLSNLTLTNSAIVGLGSTNFQRSIGTGPDQFQFVSGGRSGWAAFVADRTVNIGGVSAPFIWSSVSLGQLVLSAPTADHTLDFQNPIDFGSTARNIRTLDGSAAIDGIISGGITATGSAGLTKSGDGTLSLTAASNYTGPTIVNGGVLLLGHAGALPTASNLTLSSAAVVGLGTSNFSRDLGTGAGQVQFTGNGGFSAHGADRTVLLNSGATLTWAIGGFVPNTNNLVLSWESADALVDFQNPINLNGAARNISARNGTADVDARVSGIISGSGPGSSLVKSQGGTLDISAANTYEGPTQISTGVLLLTNANSIPGGVQGGNNSNIAFGGTGGAIGLGQSDFTSAIGTGPGQVQFLSAANGGFAAYGADRVVNLGGALAPVTWNFGGFATANLLLSAVGATHTVDFQNSIDLNSALRTVATRDGHADVDGILSGVISGLGGSLQKNSPGTLVVTATNTYDGGTIVDNGSLLVNNTSGSGVGTGDVTVSTGGTLGGTGFVGTPGDASNVTVNTGGHLAPGASPGTFTVHGDVSFQSGTFFDLDLAVTASAEFDQLEINGAATLDGTVQLQFVDGYTPALGDSFEVLTATGGLTGEFIDMLAPTISGIGWELSYSSTAVLLNAVEASTSSDFNHDGTTDAADYVLWRKLDGSLTGYQIWQENFGVIEGGPGVGGSVPEPSEFSFFATIVFVASVWRLRARGK